MAGNEDEHFDITNTLHFTCLGNMDQVIFCLCLVMLYGLMLLSVLVWTLRRFMRRSTPIERAFKKLDDSVRSFEVYIKAWDSYAFQNKDPDFQERNERIQVLIDILNSCKTKVNVHSKVIQIEEDSVESSFQSEGDSSITISEEESFGMIDEIETPLSVQVYRKDDSFFKKDFIVKLFNMLNTNTEKEIEFIECHSANQIDSNLPVFILCLSSSRLGSDAVNAIRDVQKVRANMALLVCNHQEVHALPKTSSALRLTDAIFTGIGGIFDLAFTTEKGLYDCEMNTCANDAIVKFVLQNT